MYDNLNDFSRIINNKRIICYGAGVNALFMLSNKYFKQYIKQVEFFVDIDIKKSGTFIGTEDFSFEIKPITVLDECSKEWVVIVTLSDYVRVGQMLEEKGFKWFSWLVISTDIKLDMLDINFSDMSQNCFLLNTPDYINLGDQAIAVAEDIYLKNVIGNYYQFGTNVCHLEGLKKLKKYIKPNDIIFVQGGGNLGSLWRTCEENFRNIIKTFKDNSIIVFPQSVFYGNSDEEKAYLEESKKIYNGHHSLLICVRDLRSYDFIKKNYICNCMLVPDMVMTLKKDFRCERKGIGVILRNDKEKYISEDYEKVIAEVVANLGEELVSITHHPVEDISERIKLVENVLKTYASCKIVITDRLHGMIFSAITNTPCIAFNNSYHKVSDVYNTWLKDCKHITFSEMIPMKELQDIVYEKIKLEYSPYDANKYYYKLENLTKYINKLK